MGPLYDDSDPMQCAMLRITAQFWLTSQYLKQNIAPTRWLSAVFFTDQESLIVFIVNSV